MPLAIKGVSAPSQEAAVVRAALLYAIATAPIIAMTIANRHLAVALVGVAAGMAGLSASALMPTLLVQSAAPSRFRARMIAFFLLINTLISLGLGPTAVAMLAARNPTAGLGGALSLLASLALIPALLCYAGAYLAVRLRDGRVSDKNTHVDTTMRQPDA